MKGSRAKELKYKILAEVSGQAFISEAQKEAILNSKQFKKVFRRAKKDYNKK